MVSTKPQCTSKMTLTSTYSCLRVSFFGRSFFDVVTDFFLAFVDLLIISLTTLADMAAGSVLSFSYLLQR